LLITLALAIGAIVIPCKWDHPAAAAQTAKPTAIQLSQVAFLMTYGHDKATGKAPTQPQALAVVYKYPKVLTMAEAAQFGFTTQPRVLPSPAGNAQTASTTSNNVKFKKTCISGDYQYWRGPSFAQELGWNQSINWCYNTQHKWVGKYTTRGYPWVVDWVSWMWSYSGEYTSDGYPYWSTGGGGSKPGWAKYWFIETFKWGYGPISGTFSMDLWIRCDSTGNFQGGKF
jgi:hypothetical protein